MKRLRSRKRRKPEITHPTPQPEAKDGTFSTASAARATDVRLGAFYANGPVVTLRPVPEEERLGPKASEITTSDADSAPREEEAMPQAVKKPGPTVQGQVPEEQAVAHAMQGTLRLEGRTDAQFSSSFTTQNVVIRSETDCAQCPDGKQIHVTGTLVARYRVTTTVTLPRVSDYPGLRPCQQRRVRDAINNVLRPHEQDHVAAFRQYNGTTRTPFDLTLCRGEFDSTIQSMFDTQDQARRDAAQAASDALDPFYFDVDLDCED